MAIIFNESAAAPEPIDKGVTRQRLLTGERVQGTRVLLDRLTLAAGATMQFNLPAKSLGWFQLLGGEAKFKAYYTDRLSHEQSVVLPSRFNATLTTTTGASLLCAEIPDLGRLSNGAATSHPLFIVVDWTREPVWASARDARRRIALATPEMCETAAIKVEMVIYPKGSMAPECHHEGADTVMYILTGNGSATANGESYSVGAGDLIYFPDRERHSLRAANDGEIRFLEIHVPAEFKTVWTDKTNISAWQLTDRDINGFETEMDAKQRHAFRFVFPFPVM